MLPKLWTGPAYVISRLAHGVQASWATRQLATKAPSESDLLEEAPKPPQQRTQQDGEKRNRVDGHGWSICCALSLPQTNSVARFLCLWQLASLARTASRVEPQAGVCKEVWPI